MVLLDLEFIKSLGKGSQGSVSLFKYKYPVSLTTFYTAVKTSDRKHALSLCNEFRILSQFKGCSRIVQCCENSLRVNMDLQGNTEYMMLMEFAYGGSLRNLTASFKDRILPERLIKDFTRMLLEGLAIIHGHGYVHCDLKPENVLVFPTHVYKNGAWRFVYELKISDFGLSKRDGDSNWWQTHRPFAGTPIYMSPESVSHGETGKGLDLWSLGCVVLEMYTGKTPWWHKNYDLKDLKKSYHPLIPNDLPCDAKHFIMTCFSLETDDRRDALTLLEHSFLRGDVGESPVKNENPKEVAPKPSQVTSILERDGELKIIKKHPRPNLAKPSKKLCFFTRRSV